MRFVVLSEGNKAQKMLALWGSIAKSWAVETDSDQLVC